MGRREGNLSRTDDKRAEDEGRGDLTLEVLPDWLFSLKHSGVDSPTRVVVSGVLRGRAGSLFGDGRCRVGETVTGGGRSSCGVIRPCKDELNVSCS